MKSLKYLLVALAGLLMASGCQSLSRQRQRVNQLEIGQTFETPGPVKLLDGKRFVMVDDNAGFEREEDLELYQIENAPGTVYPSIYFAEGIYEKIGEEYRFWVQRSVEVEFKNVANIKKKIISTRRFDNVPAPKDKYFSFTKKDGYYRVNGNQRVFTSDQEIPDSIDGFLAQYKYEPEELE